MERPVSWTLSRRWERPCVGWRPGALGRTTVGDAAAGSREEGAFRLFRRLDPAWRHAGQDSREAEQMPLPCRQAEVCSQGGREARIIHFQVRFPEIFEEYLLDCECNLQVPAAIQLQGASQFHEPGQALVMGIDWPPEAVDEAASKFPCHDVTQALSGIGSAGRP